MDTFLERGGKFKLDGRVLIPCRFCWEALISRMPASFSRRCYIRDTALFYAIKRSRMIASSHPIKTSTRRGRWRLLA